MRSFFNWLVVACIFSVLTAAPSSAQEAPVDRAQPETIDPLQPGIGDFLDVDIAGYEKTAREAYDAKDYERAAKYYLALLRYDINDGGSVYNLACCYGLLGEAELAAKYLERAVKAGFQPFSQVMWDPDFNPVRETEVFKQAVERLTEEQKREDSSKGKLVFLEAPTYHKCWVHLPDSYDPARSYTLVVGLHGYGANPESFTTLWERFAEHDFIFASLQAPYAFSQGSAIGYSWTTDLPEDEEFWKQAALMSADYIGRAVEQLRGRYNVSEVFLLGFSQGCTLTYLTGILKHDLFAGLICFAGVLETDVLTEEDIGAANHLRVFIAHGDEDRVVELAAGENARDKLTEHGYDVTFHIFKGAHRVPEEAVHAAEAWMKGQGASL